MKTLISVFALGLVLLVSVGVLPSSESRENDEHTAWVAKSLREIETVKVGMTRVDLLKVFTEEGGISTRTWQRYVYRDCPYIKVDVEFELVGEQNNRIIRNSEDRIIKISKPFLEWTILD